MIFLRNYYANTTSKTDALLVTEDIKRAVRESGILQGLITVLVPGGTAGVVMLENDPKLREEYKLWIEQQVSAKSGSRPARKSGTGKDEAHLRAALVGAQISIPLQNGKPMLGAWQEVVLLDFEDKVGRREFTIQIMGEGGEGQ